MMLCVVLWSVFCVAQHDDHDHDHGDDETPVTPAIMQLVPRGFELVSPTSNYAGLFMLAPNVSNDRPVYKREGPLTLYVYHVVSGEALGRWMVGPNIGSAECVRTTCVAGKGLCADL